MPRDIIDSVQGTLDFLILKTLAGGELHGYVVARSIFDRSSGSRKVRGTRCIALEGRGWIAAEWGLSENNRRTKFYRLTLAGERELVKRAGNCRRLTMAVSQVVDAIRTGCFSRDRGPCDVHGT